ncbi:hypothetical protein [Phaeobacter inhibens]|uniref:hypothetical protein n=1 Tax=Phaeobacter inhibens TaxID=221822 RepID=UPI0020C7D7B4|nr:hypothetical protein [Phaeobacter inhibens]
MSIWKRGSTSERWPHDQRIKEEHTQKKQPKVTNQNVSFQNSPALGAVQMHKLLRGNRGILGTPQSHFQKGERRYMISPRQWIAVPASAAVSARFWYPAPPAPAGQSLFSSAAFGGDLMAEAKVNLTGIRPELEGEWLITSVTHRLGTTLTTSFKAERDNEKAKT